MSESQPAGFKPKKSVALSGVTAGNTALVELFGNLDRPPVRREPHDPDRRAVEEGAEALGGLGLRAPRLELGRVTHRRRQHD